MDINRLLRKNILNFAPYRSARDEFSGTAATFLDANENALGSTANGNLNRYPDPDQSLLKEKISEVFSINRNQIFLGNGSDEAIDLLLRAFCEPRTDRILLMPPTYGMYSICANLNDVSITEVPLTPAFDIDLPVVLEKIQPGLKLIFICSPNNPSGNILNFNSINKILSEFPGLVVIDEAYQDFSGQTDWLSETANHENLVVLRTFSKAWGLANIRMGMAFAAQPVITVLNRIKYPYNVNGITAQTALAALQNLPKKEQMTAAILQQREILADHLNKLDIVETIFPSQANFLLVRFKHAAKIFDFLKENSIIVRDRSGQIHCQNCLRITIGSPAENKKLIETLTRFEGSL